MLTYIEPCGWCSSSISSTKCPSNIDRSTEPCPNLSSSLDSRSSISINNSISLSTDSISYEKERRRISTNLIRSSFHHPNDYHTTKRIDELHERMDDIQISSFLKFINYHLSLKKDHENLHINDFIKDLSNGHILIDLIEILSSTKLKREHGHTRFHSLTNIQYVLDYLKLRMSHINISPHDIVSGNRKQILALLWIIMKIFNFPSFRLINKNCFVENTLLGFGQDRSIILKWLNHLLNQSLNTHEIYIRDFYLQTWLNNSYLLIILKYLLPLSLKYLTIKCFDYIQELNNWNNYDKNYFQICFNLSNYCFETITIIDYTDKSEKSLFKYFTELQQKIFIILKTNNISKLIQTNPYTKQILDTIIQTTEHSSYTINDNEQYLVCIEEEEKLTMNNRTIEKSRLLNDDDDERKNQAKKIENVQSNLHIINGHNETVKEEQVKMTIDKSQQFNNLNKKFDQPVLLVEKTEYEAKDQIKLDELIVTTQNFEQISSTIEQLIVVDRDTEQITETNVESQINEELEQTRTGESQRLIESNEQSEHETLEQAIDSHDEIEQSVKNENSLITNEKVKNSEEIIEPIISNEKLEQPTLESEESQQLVESTEQNNHDKSGQITNLHAEIEQSVKNENFIASDEKVEHSTTTEELIESANEEPQQEQVITFNKDDQLSVNEYEKSEQTVSSVTIDEQKQLLPSNEKVEQVKIENEPTEQEISTISEDVPSVNNNDKLEQSFIGTEDVQQSLTSNTENNKSTIKYEKLEQPTIDETSKFVLSNKEHKQNTIKIDNNSYSIPININEKFEQFTIKETPESIISNNETSVTSNDKLQQQPISKLEEIKQFIIKNERLDQSSVPIEKVEEIIDNKPVSVMSNEGIEKSSVTKMNNNSNTKNKNLKQSTRKELSSSLASNERIEEIPVTTIDNNLIMIYEKTPITSVENDSSVRTSKILEKHTVINTQQPIASNGQISKSINANKKSASSVQENQRSIISHEQPIQSTIIVKEPEQRKTTSEPLVQTFRCSKYSDVVNKQLPKPNIESVQGAISFKKQEQSTVSNKKVTSPVIAIEKSNQSRRTVEEIEQVPFTSTIKESEQSDVSFKKQEQSTVSKKKVTPPVIPVETIDQSRTTAGEIAQLPFTSTIKESEQSGISLEKQEQSTIVMNKSYASGTSNQETKTSPNKNKKSRRSHAKKGKTKNSSVRTEIPQQNVISTAEKEEVEPSLPSLNIQEQQNPTSEISNLSTILKTSPNNTTSMNNEKLQNSSALRSRKNKKKKTTTTLIEKSSSSSIPITTANRNFLHAITGCMHDRTNIAFKCVFIFICLCFAIVILVLSHK